MSTEEVILRCRGGTGAALALRLSPYAVLLRDERDENAIRWGVGHLLTGQCFGISEPLLAWITQDRDEDSELSPARILSLDGALDALKQFSILIDADTEDTLAPWREQPLTWCAMNPAVSLVERGQRVLVRLVRTDMADFPRTGNPPRVLKETMPPEAAFVAEHANGQFALRDLAERWARDRGLSEAEGEQQVDAGLLWLAHPVRQAVKFLAPPTRKVDRWPPHHVVLQHYRHIDNAHRMEQMEDAGTSAATFYQVGLTEGHWNFDWVEPTVAHAFRKSNEALDGRAYGAAFYDAVTKIWNQSMTGQTSILEIGGGVGYFAQAFLQRAVERAGEHRSPTYTILDLSPALVDAQRRLLNEGGTTARFVQGGAENPPLPSDAFDIIISNEVIADLPVTKIGSAVTGVRNDAALVSTNQPNPRLVHTGAMAMIKHIARMLRSGGVAVLTEYGADEVPPIRTTHLNHPEYSIHFAQLVACATKLGLDAETIALPRLLGAAPDTAMLCGGQEKMLCLREALCNHATPPDYRAYDHTTWRNAYGSLTDRLYLMGLHWRPLTDGTYYGPDMRQFRALVLHKLQD